MENYSYGWFYVIFRVFRTWFIPTNRNEIWSPVLERLLFGMIMQIYLNIECLSFPIAWRPENLAHLIFEKKNKGLGTFCLISSRFRVL